jgi:PAS domain S-box-containing protein
MNRTSEQNGTVAVPPAQYILDALAGPVAVLDRSGCILAVNRAWHDFGHANQVSPGSHIGLNYLDICERATGGDAPCARAVAAGIRSVLAGQDAFALDYPCHSPTQQRWFQLRASRLRHQDMTYAVVSHHDITERVLIEQERQGLLAKAHRYQERLKTLASISASVASISSPDAIFEEMTDQARQIIGAHWAATHTMPYVLWPRDSIIVSASERYRDQPPRAIGDSGTGIYAYVLQSGQPLRLTEAELRLHPDLQGYLGPELDRTMLRGVLAVPVFSPQGGTLGVIMLSDKQSGSFTPDDESILVQLAQIASVSIERAVQARAERESRERLSATYEHANVGIGETNAGGRFVTVNKGFTTITGYSRDELLSLSIFDLAHPDDAESERALYERQVAGKLRTYSLEKRYTHKDGSSAWLAVSSTAVFNEQGRFQYSVRVVQDIDQKKRFEQRQALLVRELHHRVRNTLAVIEALAGATARTASNMRDFTHSFSSRVSALAKTQTLLTEDYWQTASLREMLLCELRPFDEKRRERFRLEGPEVHLAADIAVPLSMAFHELTANAAKYGALSVRKGCVSVTWEVVDLEGRRELHLRWAERNGPSVEPPAHQGFGSALLHRVLPAQCQAQVQLDFNTAGLQFEAKVPLLMRRLVPEY